MMVCSLCMKNEESHDHLIFMCKYSHVIWDRMQEMMDWTVLYMIENGLILWKILQISTAQSVYGVLLED